MDTAPMMTAAEIEAVNDRRKTGKLTVAEAIAWEEGFYKLYTRSNRNHNPGNIEVGKFAKAHGAVGCDSVYAIFPDDRTGFAAMQALMLSAYKGLTLRQIVFKWAPPKENNSEEYLANVAKWTGLNETFVQVDFPVPVF